MTDYTPIACGEYSRYELAILRRQKMRLVWHEHNVVYDRVVLPVDLQTRDHEEYLTCRGPTGETFVIRLDHIRRAVPA